MAQGGTQIDSAKFCCSICLDLLQDPVTIPCGHSYCMSCIKTCWDGEEQKKIYSCPQCRQTFTPRPVLVKSTMLAELLEEIKKTRLQAAPPDLCYAGPGDVACDVCTTRKRKALRFCQVCLASYCEHHLQPHYDAPPLKRHKLVEATVQPQDNICSRHGEVMKIFCRSDQQCICYLCSVDGHNGHDTISAAAERTERQKELWVSRQKVHKKMLETHKNLMSLHQEVKSILFSADKAVEDSEKIFTELMHFIWRRKVDVKLHIRSQQKKEVSQGVALLKRLKQEIDELRRKDAELEQLSHTEDHIHFLQNYPSLSCLSESTDSPSNNIRPLRSFEDVPAVMSKARDKLQASLDEEWSKITGVTTVDDLLTQPEPKTRDEFFQHSCPITLDPNTAHTRLSLSKQNRKATLREKKQSYPSHPDRFVEMWQVLSKESLSGRCYWEVEWRGEGVLIAVSYKDIGRTGTDDACGFGCNDKSWALDCYMKRYQFTHNNIVTPIQGQVSSRVGVYLDHRAGILSFYSVSEAMTLLHRVQTTFTQPLYVGFWLPRFSFGNGASAVLCHSK